MDARPAAWVWLLSLLGGLAFGVTWGNTSNHQVYLLSGLQESRPGFLAKDWFVNETTQYHTAFSTLVTLLDGWGLLGWGLALSNVLVVTLALVVIAELVREVTPEQHEEVWLVVASGMLWTGGASAAYSYMFSPSLQPSSLAMLGYLLAVWAWVRGAWGVAGLCAAAAGWVHSNFLILAVPWFGLSALWIERRVSRRVVLLMLPTATALALRVPHIVHTMGLELPAELKERANRLYIDFAVPIHYRPHVEDVLPLAVWLVLLASLAVRHRWEGPRARLLTLWGVGAAGLGVAMVCTVGVMVDTISRLFVYRLAPLISLLGGVWVMSLAAERWSLRRWRIPLLVVFGAGALSLVNPGRHWLLYDVRTADDALYAWTRTTPRDTVMMIPPLGLSAMRLLGQRAIVVDVRGLPARPDEIVAWYERLSDLAGEPPTSMRALRRGYYVMSKERAAKLCRTYGVGYVVVRESAPLASAGWPVAFRRGPWVVLKAPR